MGVFLLPFLPFVVTNSMFFPFITGKNFAFRILVEILFGLWVILAIWNPRYRPSFSWILVAVFSFVAIIGLADLLGENPFKSFWSNFERMEGFIGLLHLGAYFLVVGTVLNTQKLWFALANTSVIASVIMGVYGLLQLSGKIVINQGGVRVDGTFGNAAYLAVYMLFHVFVTAFLMAKWRGSNVILYIYGVALLLQIFILFQTATRGTILGLAAGTFLVAFLVLVFGKEYSKLRKISGVFIVSVLLFAGGIFLARDTSFVENNPVLSRLASISLEAGESRFTIWGMAIEGWKERPVLGWGQENFNFVFNKYYDPSLYRDEPWFDRAHNVFFDWLTASGVLGLLGYLTLFGSALWCLWRKATPGYFSVHEKSILTGLFAAYLVHNFFVFDNVMSYILFFSVLAYVYSSTCTHSSKSRSFEHPIAYKVVPSAVLLVTVAVIYFVNIPGIKTSRAMIDALSTVDVDKRIELFERAASYNVVGSQEVAEQLVQLATLTLKNDTVSVERKQQLFTLAEREMLEHLERTPNDARLRVFLGSLYDQFGQAEKARGEFEQARMLSPQKQRIIYQLAFTHLNSGDTDEARILFKEAYDAEPESDQSTIYYAALLIFDGETTQAEKLLEPIRQQNFERKGVRIIDDSLLTRAYAATGQFEKILAIWDHKLSLEPNNINHRLARSATLIQLNRNEEAVREIQRAIAIEPAFKERGEFYISEIRAGRGAALVR